MSLLSSNVHKLGTGASPSGRAASSLNLKYMGNDIFSEPPQRADSKNPIFIFCRILGPGHLQGPGVSLGRILGGGVN